MFGDFTECFHCFRQDVVTEYVVVISFYFDISCNFSTVEYQVLVVTVVPTQWTQCGSTLPTIVVTILGHSSSVTEYHLSFLHTVSA